MEGYTVQLDEYSGPLDLLLQLIEEQQMDITKVSLAAVADQFIVYMQQMQNLNPEEVADFLVVVAKLLYIKSKALLPTIDLEDDGIDLEKQLRLYKEFVAASKKIHALVTDGKYNYVREKYPEELKQGFHPPEGLTAPQLGLLFAKVLKRLEPIFVLPKRVIEKTVNIHEKIQHIKDIILREASISFARVISDAGSKTEKIVSFLAMLELVKQRMISVEQEKLFDDIIIKRV